MKNLKVFVLVGALSISLLTHSSDSNAMPDNTKWVDPFIGTQGDSGQLSPAATVPFGMVQMGPETGYPAHSGYDYTSQTLIGFSHTRTMGVGCRGAGGSLLMRADYATGESGLESFLAPVSYNKPSESAAPGQYSVKYGSPTIDASMSVTPSTGIQRYRFTRKGEILLSIDTGYAHHERGEGSYTIRSDRQITGFVSGPTVCKAGRFAFHFSMTLSSAPKTITEIDKHRLTLHFDVDAGSEIVVHTGISSVSAEQAEQARRHDLPDMSFDHAVETAHKTWRDALGKFSLQGSTQDKTLFFTHLYHLYLSPANLTNSIRTYRASDGQVYVQDQGDYYFGWSVWDNFRTQLPLLTILEPQVMGEVTRSLAQLYSQGKQNWATEQAPLPTVRTEHSGVVILDAWKKGIRTVDVPALLPHLINEVESSERNTPDQILEGAYDDWAISEFADIVGKPELAKRFRLKAREYRTMWASKMLNINDKFDVMHGDGLYEGTLWQYRWFVPYDVQWVINTLGGEAVFNDQLSYFFDNHLFNMGNQPDIQTPFMFTFSGQPWKTQEVIFDLLHTNYPHWYGTHEKHSQPQARRAFTASPDGMIFEMDNDAGTMSGWYVFVAMGLYPALPGEPVYSLHTPQLRNIQIELGNGNVVEISTNRDPKQYKYIDSVSLNGETLNRAWIHHSELIEGAKLHFTLTDQPNMTWGKNTPFVTALDK